MVNPFVGPIYIYIYIYIIDDSTNVTQVRGPIAAAAHEVEHNSN
jgi:hypothetical protein